jgi:uncharacterized repeat protein (TIGR01451 family)
VISQEQSWLRRLRQGAALAGLFLLSSWVAAASEPPASPGDPGWQAVIERPGLSSELRVGAEFAARHLPVALFHSLPANYQDTLLRYAAQHSQGQPSLVICWEQNTPDMIAKPFLEIEQAGKAIKQRRQSPQNVPVGTAFQASDTDHWSRTAVNGSSQNVQGLPITLTWSIVPDGTVIPGGAVGGEGSNEPSNLRAWLAAIYGGNATGPAASQPWFPIFQAVFDNIAAKTGVRYVYEPNDDGVTLSSFSSSQGLVGVRGDVRISGHRLDGNNNVLAYNYFPDHSDMVLDTSDSFYNNTANNSRGLRNVIEHEHGHGLGLAHVCPVNSTKLMEPYINLGFVGIQFDDLFTMQRLYGDFLEMNGASRSNDTFAAATPIQVPEGGGYGAEWLGIDDNTDTDYFSFTAPAGSQLTVRVSPSTASYLEGAQNPDGSCTGGTLFNSSALQNLGLTVFGPDQATVLGVAANQPAGSPEGLLNLPVATGGTHYVRVVGSGANSNQLYRLEIDVFLLRLASASVVAELFSETNGAPDPGETVRLQVTLENVGQQTAPNVLATLSGPDGFQGFDVARAYGDIASGGSANGEFTFALAGTCGEVFGLSLAVAVEGANLAVLPLTVGLGVEGVLIQEDFETNSSPPAGWGNSKTGQGSLWSVVDSRVNPGLQSLFADDYQHAGQSILTTPPLPVGEIPGRLRFNHFYNTQAGIDGCVLEILVGSNAWTDIVAAGGTFLSGAYNATLGASQNPLAGRSAWSGTAGGLVATEVDLPAAAANQSVQLRWIIGHNEKTSGDGWYLEDIRLSLWACASGMPLLTLSSTDTSMSEYSNATDTAVITVSAGLPVAAPLAVPLLAAGSASPLLDLTGLDNLTLAAGSASTSLVLTAISDGLVEGNETLILTSPDATGSVLVTVLDTPYGQLASALLGTIGPVNPFDDFDSDNSLNVEELLFGSDLASADSWPLIHLQPEGSGYKLPALIASLPAGITVEGESSTDLLSWAPQEVTVLPDGLWIPGEDPQRFLRLRYEVRETAP